MQRCLIFSKRTNFSCFLCDLRQLFLSFCVFVAKQCDCRNNFRRKTAKNLFLIENCHNFASTKEINDNLLTKKIRTMANYNFNAKKVLMSTIAAVAFSFVFTTNADAIRVKVRVKAPQNKTVAQKQQDQQKQEDCNRFLLLLKQMFGVRV